MSTAMEEFCSLLDEAVSLARDIEEAAAELIDLLEKTEPVRIEEPEI